MTEAYPEVANVLAAMTDEQEQIALVRLAAKWNNGSEHFDHSPEGYSWPCLACAQNGEEALGRLAVLFKG